MNFCLLQVVGNNSMKKLGWTLVANFVASVREVIITELKKKIKKSVLHHKNFKNS